MSEKPIIIKTAEIDNVGVVANMKGLPSGTILDDGTRLTQNVPIGHKVALTIIPKGAAIVRYGQIIGFAAETIPQGGWVQERLVLLPTPPALNSIPLNSAPEEQTESLEGYTFEGYRNADGSVGTKNILGITTSVQCVAGLTDYVSKRIRQELLPKYPNVDDVVPLNHSYGCGVAINAPAAIVPIRTIKNMATNPNLGGEVFVIGLGCEKLLPERLLPAESESEDKLPAILLMQDERFQGFNEMAEGVMQLAERYLQKLNRRKRETCPASDLIVGMQCGGSDAFSGITSNPVAGFAADLIVRAGGSVMFSEVTEVRDAIHLLVPRAVSEDVGRALLREMKWYDDYLQKGEADRSANPSPGNKTGGLSNVVEKALGSIAKSGSSPIVDVLSPGEKIRKKGLTFAATPASDFVCGTLQLASGMNMHVFMTGRGTPYGLQMVPVIKVGSNSKLSNRWFDLIDLDAGKVALGEKTIEEMGWELFQLILDVASGRKQVACDKLGLHNDLVLFNPGPVT
ncbi:galactarate dehydratase [Mangrovibacterium lignilyticum]|uniref:galactarate dehydratase n=1 Tax=Mangrovibacterium lignilyticum TaxID=2668052 RepID=UPI0013CFE352|nr:galactarate dehydratase [Mangrovibacterium lignilyticum]